MNENIDLTKILKDCPKGTKLYSTIFGEVEFNKIEESNYPIVFIKADGGNFKTTANGKHYESYNGECTLFPSKDQRDWSKFSAPWYKKKKFDLKTLKPFDKVLVRDHKATFWSIDFFAKYLGDKGYLPIKCLNSSYIYCIPYNDDTKHLVYAKEEAPEYYRYWED